MSRFHLQFSKNVSLIILLVYCFSLSCALDSVIYSVGNYEREARGNGIQIDFTPVSKVYQDGVLKGKTIESIHAANFNALVVTSDGQSYGWGR